MHTLHREDYGENYTENIRENYREYFSGQSREWFSL